MDTQSETIQVLAEATNGKRTAIIARVTYPNGLTAYRVSVTGGNVWQTPHDDPDGFSDMLQLFAHVSGELVAMNIDYSNADEQRGVDAHQKRKENLPV